MTKTEQKKLIKGILKGIEKSILEKLPVIPEEWDGHELRHLVVDYAKTNVSYVPMCRRRKREYSNLCLVHNLY